MEEIKVGEYIRTKDGFIIKTTDYLISEYKKHGDYKKIKKHSFNILEILEKRRLYKWR